MNNENLLKNDKKVLICTKELQEHHAFLIQNHFKSSQLDIQTDDIQEPTAFPTPNHLYKQKINKSVKKILPKESNYDK